MNYPIVIHKDKQSDYGVIVPDLPGCFSAGSSVDEAMVMAKEAIELHLEGLVEQNMVIPSPSPIERYKKKREYAGGTWAFVNVDTRALRLTARRLNITMPQRVVDAVDNFAQRRGETRSGLLTSAALQYLNSETNKKFSSGAQQANSAHKRKITA